MRGKTRACLTAVVILAVFALAWMAGYQLRAQGGQWQPYTIVRTADSTNSATGHQLHRLEIIARRSDGSRVDIDSSDPGTRSQFGNREIVLTSEHKRIDVNDYVKMMSTYYIDSIANSPTDPMCGLSRYAPSAKATFKGEHEILGYRTIMIQTDNGPFLTTDSKSPDLACETLQMSEYERQQNGEPTGRRFELIATEVLRGEPDPSLFRIPPSYAEALPSEVSKAVSGLHPEQPPTDRMLENYQMEDRRYMENHRLRGVQ